jgi:hypothetical protein
MKFTTHSCIHSEHVEEEIKPHHRLAGWSGHYYLWACHRARLTVSDWIRVYEQPTSIKEQENE